MGKGNVDVIRQLYAQFRATGEIESILGVLDPAIVWVDRIIGLGRMAGHDGFVDAMARLSEQGYEVEADPEHYEEIDGRTVLATGYARLKQGDTYVELPSYTVFVLHDGKVVRGAGATRRAEAIEALNEPPAAETAPGRP